MIINIIHNNSSNSNNNTFDDGCDVGGTGDGLLIL